MGHRATNRGKRGIFCLEREWESDLRSRRSVLPVLDLLEANGSTSYIHRDVGTCEELALYLSKFRQQRYKQFEVLFLAFHGSRGGNLYVGNENLSLESLAEMLEDSAKGKIIYFGSCGTLNVSPNRLDQFRRQTKARYVAGYTKNIDAISSLAFEVALLDALAYFERPAMAFNHVASKSMSSLAKALGFTRFPQR